MARYQILRVGVWDTVASQRIIPQSGDLWRAYQQWLEAGNVPDPYVPPTPAVETLVQAKQRKKLAIKVEAVQRMQTRFPAIRNADTVQLLRELMLSIVPAARDLTTDMQWIVDTYQAGETALAAVNAATTIPDVDAVTPAWPAL